MTADVHGNWNTHPPVYRIYLNDDLLTERTFRWPGYQVFIKEHMVCILEPGIHKLRIENASSHGSFRIDNLNINNSGAQIHPNYIDYTGQDIHFIIN
jgi:hypothetical protein